jgi:hypothetical protein
MQTVNLNFCSILATPPIFTNVFRTVGDANTTESIMPIIPSPYSLCKFSVSLTATKDGAAYNPHTIIGFVDQFDINSTATTLVITWNTSTTISNNAGLYVVTVKYTLPNGTYVNSTFNFTLGCGANGLVINSPLAA